MGPALDQPMPPRQATGATSGFGDAQPLSAAVQDAITTSEKQAQNDMTNPLLVAAKGGDALAQFEMGRRLTLGKDMRADMTTAAKWFEKAAEQNMAPAQYSLANLYEKGHGVKKDLAVARLWYERAAEAGNVKAMHNLAVLFAEGGLGRPDFNQATHWFLKAANHGLKDSQYNLAILFARGMGVKQDLMQSYKWFDIAAQNGDQGAATKRDEVFRVLTSAQQKTAKAIVAAWVPKVAKPSANQVASIPDAWKVERQEIFAANSGKGGMSSPASVRKAQSMLGALGYNAGPADGQMGPRTTHRHPQFPASGGVTGHGHCQQGTDGCPLRPGDLTPGKMGSHLRLVIPFPVHRPCSSLSVHHCLFRGGMGAAYGWALPCHTA